MRQNKSLFMQLLILLTASLGAAAPALGSTIFQPKEIVLFEGKRPTNGWRTHAGTCDNDNYQVTIALGKGLGDAVLGAKVNGVRHGESLRLALKEWATVKGIVMDAVVVECGSRRARIVFEVMRPMDRPELHFYYLWIDKNGNVDLIGER